jgi:nitrogen fixation protein FixH
MSMSRKFTGYHMAAIMVGFFGIIIAVNLTMARYAVSTFGGIVVENSYVASQEFNGWLEEARKQEALGWDAVTAWRPDNRLAVQLSGVPQGATVSATARHPLGRQPDHELAFEPNGEDRFLSTRALPEGRWLLRLEVAAGGREWRRQEELR